MDFFDLIPDTDFSGPARPDPYVSPREIELVKYRTEKTPLRIRLVTGEEIEGVITWYDDRAIGVAPVGREGMTVYLNAVAYYGPAS
jgi:sRNA-binding regulator protein Hfq